MGDHFFPTAPVLGWAQWIYRTLFSVQQIEPSIYPVSIETAQQPQASTGTKPTKLQAKYATQYSKFLATYYTNPSSPIQLLVPSCIFSSGLTTGALQGIELRTKDGTLIGMVVSFYTGFYTTYPTGLITWLCVHPSWRNQGVSNCLLRAVYAVFAPTQIYLFRNDGFLKSYNPPVYIQARMQRKKPYVALHTSTNNIHRVPYTKWSTYIQITWKQANPNGFLLEDTSFQHRLLETWELQISSTSWCVVLLQPTFECQRTTPTEQWCEILTWLFVGSNQTTYEQSYTMERLLDATPYMWFDAPSSLPHIESNWTQAGYTYWSVLGLDPGTPVLRPILSLCAS